MFCFQRGTTHPESALVPNCDGTGEIYNASFVLFSFTDLPLIISSHVSMLDHLEHAIIYLFASVQHSLQAFLARTIAIV